MQFVGPHDQVLANKMYVVLQAILQRGYVEGKRQYFFWYLSILQPGMQV